MRMQRMNHQRARAELLVVLSGVLNVNLRGEELLLRLVERLDAF